MLRGFTRMRQLGLSVSFSFLLVACNSDGGDSASTPTPTELPFSVEIQGPAPNNALGTAVSFSAGVADPSNKLKYQWQFGDGESSTQANPTHNYAKAGVYRVQLIVTNEVGANRASTADVSVSDGSITNGKQCSGDNNGGWCWQQPLPTGNILNDYSYVDQKHGWAVGERGTILSTSDGGASWQQQKSGSELPLSRVVFTSAQDGWAVASNGAILKTGNGGATWNLRGYRQAIQVQTFGASDANTAWVQGNEIGEVLITRDGGSSWSAMSRLTGVSRYLPVNASVVWAADYNTTTPVLYRTLNGGARWEAVKLPALASGLHRRIDSLVAGENEVWLTGEDSGWQNNWVSNSFAFKTSDAGQTWQAFTPYSSNMKILQFTNTKVGFALADNDSTLLRSMDGGMTWERLSLPPNMYSDLSAVLKILSDTRLTIRDYYGRTFTSIDSGTSWQEQTIGAQGYFHSITGLWFFDSRQGVAIGEDGTIKRTLDGGQTWVSSVAASSSGGWRRLQFMADGIGWVLGDLGAIYRSTDKGNTWVATASQTSNSAANLADFHFINAYNGWAVKGYPSGEDGQKASIFRTTDGGVSWSPVNGTGEYSGLSSIRFADGNTGVAVGRGGLVLVTTDGGASWSARSSGVTADLTGLTFIDSSTAIAVGDQGTIVRSTDRGLTWKQIPAVSRWYLSDVQFLSPKLGWAVGSEGTVLATRDGGLSWSVQSSSSNSNFSSVFFVNEQTGWIGGSGGAIMATATGGR